MVKTSRRPAGLPKAQNALWDWMEKQGWTQREMARQWRWSHNTLNHYLYNRRTPGLAKLDFIYQKTGIPIALWLDTRVSKAKKTKRPQGHSAQCLQTGNAHAS